MPAMLETLRILYLGGQTDRERTLLESFGARVRVVTPAAAVDADDVDAVVAIAPLDRATLEAIEKPLVLLGASDVGDAEIVLLPREPLSAEILELAILTAVERRSRPAADRRALAQRHFQRIFEASPVGIALTSIDGIVIGVNPALSELLGFGSAELVGQPATIFSDGTTETTHRSLFHRMRGNSMTVRRERRLRRKDKKILLCEVTTSMLREDDGTPVALLQTVVDVTARHDAESRLSAEAVNRHLAWEEANKAHEFLAAALQSMPQGVLVVEVPSGKAILANDRFCELTGGEAIAVADSESRIGGVRLTTEDGKTYPHGKLPLVRTLEDGLRHTANDIWIEHANGLRIPVAARSGPIDYKGRAAAILTISDMTEVKEQERARRSAEAFHRSLFEHATDAIFFLTAQDWKVVEANPAAERLLARRREDLLGTSVAALTFEPGDGQTATDFAEQRTIARRDGLARFPWRATRKKGGVVEFEATLQRLPVEGSSELLLLRAIDVTRQRALEEELRQSQKLEAIGLLAGGVAHDYNNLLTGVIGFLELALEKLPQEQPLERVRKFVNEARRAASRSVDLTRQLLTFSRRQKTAPRLMDLNESVERSVSMIQRLVGETVSIEVNLAADGCPIHGDAGQLEQVIMNLAINARDAMPKGGQLSIKTERYVADAAGARILDLPPGDYSTLVISDSGMGMSETVKSRIFEPFFTTKEIGRGTGLGLAVVHGVVNRHGGRIFVDSAPGQGTRFTIVLPTVVGAAIDKRKPDSGATGSLPRGTGSILVVDDDPMVREVTAAMLETLGYTVFKAGGAAEALEIVTAQKLDLVVSDVVMPDTNGVELERRLRRERPNLRVLLVSGYARDAFERQGIGEHEIQLLKKPLTLESLGHRVKELLSG